MFLLERGRKLWSSLDWVLQCRMKANAFELMIPHDRQRLPILIMALTISNVSRIFGPRSMKSPRKMTWRSLCLNPSPARVYPASAAVDKARLRVREYHQSNRISCESLSRRADLLPLLGCESRRQHLASRLHDARKCSEDRRSTLGFKAAWVRLLNLTRSLSSATL